MLRILWCQNPVANSTHSFFVFCKRQWPERAQRIPCTLHCTLYHTPFLIPSTPHSPMYNSHFSPTHDNYLSTHPVQVLSSCLCDSPQFEPRTPHSKFLKNTFSILHSSLYSQHATVSFFHWSLPLLYFTLHTFIPFFFFSDSITAHSQPPNLHFAAHTQHATPYNFLFSYLNTLHFTFHSPLLPHHMQNTTL